jgi:membrane AbrB-like protein
VTTERPFATGNLAAWSVLGIGAFLAGMIIEALGLPAAWLVGPMLIAVVFALTRPRERPPVPRAVQQAAQAVLGGVLATTFRPAVLPLIADQWLPVGLAVGGTLLLSLAGGFVLARRVHLDDKTATLGTLPGAASGMLAMSNSLGADARLVALMQYTRVVLVVLVATFVAHFAAPTVTPDHAVPASDSPSASAATPLVHDSWLAYGLTALVVAVGAWGGISLRLPAGALLGSLTACIAVEGLGILSAAWPSGVPEVAYAALGIYVGLLFDRNSVGQARRVLPSVLVTTVALMTACTGLAVAFAALTGVDFLTAYLATTPGGIDVVAIVALGSGANASLVLAVQMLRVLAVILAGHLLARRSL